MLHHSKCCILHADSKNEPWDHLGLLQMKKTLKEDFNSQNPRFPNLPHGILECIRWYILESTVFSIKAVS